MVLAVCINLHFYRGTWTTWDNNLNNSLTILILIQLVALPVFLLSYLCPNYKQLSRSRLMNRFGAIYDMIDLNHKQVSSLLWCVFFIGRRVTFAIGVIFFIEFPFFQIVMFILPTLMVIIMVGLAKPLPTPFDNKYELYNNFSILVVSYCLLCLT